MEIGNGKGPFAQLSSMTPHQFIIDDVKCASLESFIQSLKFEKPSMQASLCAEKPKSAKERGKKAINWEGTGVAHWKGISMDRLSTQYFTFMESVVAALARQCEPFRKALTDVSEDTITSAAKSREMHTPLTEAEYCKILKKVRRLNLAKV